MRVDFSKSVKMNAVDSTKSKLTKKKIAMENKSGLQDQPCLFRRSMILHCEAAVSAPLASEQLF